MKQLSLNLEFDEILDLEKVPQRHPIYPIINEFSNIIRELPYIRDLTHYRLQMVRQEMVDA